MDVNGFYTKTKSHKNKRQFAGSSHYDLWIAIILPLSLSAWPMAMDPKNSPKIP